MSRSMVGGALDGGRRWGLRSSALAVAAMSGLMAGLVLPGVPAAVASGGASPYTTLSVNVGSDPYGVAVDGATDTIYATNGGSGTVW